MTQGKTNTRSNARVDYHLAKQRISSVITTAKIAVERLGLRDKAKPHGAEYRLCCPGALHLHGDRNPSMRVFDDDGGVRVYCPVCEWGGGVVHLAGIANGDRPHEIGWAAALDFGARAAGVSLEGCAAGRGRPRKLLSDEARADLYEVYNRLLPVGAVPEWRTRPAWHDEVRAWVESRGIDVERLDKMRYAGADGRPLAGCLGADVCERIGSRTLSVLSRKEGSWDQTGHRFLAPLWDAKGRLAGFAGRATNGSADKSLTSTGAPLEGVVFANALGRVALRGRDALTEWWGKARSDHPEFNLPEYPRVYIAEGEVDFLSVALHPETETAIVFGMRKKGWSVEISGAIPTGSEVYILADADGPGCEYRDEIAKTLLGRKLYAYHVGAPEDRPDQNDLYLADRAGYSPSGVCMPYEVPASVQAAALDADEDKKPADQKLLALAVAAAPELIRNAEDGAPFFAVRRGPVESAIGASSIEASSWLRGIWDEVYPTIPLRRAVVETVRDTLADRARRQTQRTRVFMRTGRVSDCVYLDLCDGTGEAVEIGEFGYRVVARPRCYFARPDTQAAMPRPKRVPPEERRATWDAFFSLARVPEARQAQVVGWMLAAMQPDGQYPLLVLSGPEGASKSTISRILCDVVDPSTIPQLLGRDRERAAPRTEEEIKIAARHAHVLDFGNLSSLSTDMADRFCQISTGVVDGKRKLFTDDDQVLSSVVRPVVLNGIPDVATRADLLSRSIVIPLERLAAGRGREAVLREAEALFPTVLGILCDGISAYLRNGPAELDLPPERAPRLRDFYMMAEAAIEACGYARGSVIAGYESTRVEQTLKLLESSTTYRCLAKLLDAGPLIGTPSALLDRLRDPSVCHPADLRHLPSGPNGLDEWAKRFQKSLDVAGITVEKLPHDRTGTPWRILRDGADSAPRRSDVQPNADLDSLLPAPHLHLVK